MARAFWLLHPPAGIYCSGSTRVPRTNREVVKALNAVAANVSFVEVETDKGHDAFLLDEPEMFRTLDGFIRGAANARGLK